VNRIRTADRALALVIGIVTSAWVSLLCLRSHPGTTPAFLATDLLATATLVTVTGWTALAAARPATGRTASMTRMVVATTSAVLVATATQPVRILLMPAAHRHGTTWPDGVVDVLVTTALVALPVAAIVADRQSRPAEMAAARGAGLRRLGLRTMIATVVAAMAAALLIGGTAPVAAASSSEMENCINGGAPTTTFDVVAIDVDITLNAFGDHDPAGHMYALADRLPAIRAAEQSRAVSPGLRDDPIQPLIIRANMGDCVQINYTNNASGGDYGVHIDGLAFSASSSGDAVGDNSSSQPSTGGSSSYRFYVPREATLEGAHYLHPGPGYRNAVGHGLFGSLVVEPEGSTYWNSNTPGMPLRSGWEAIIKPGGASAQCDPATRACSFREALLLHHEVGNDNELIYHPDGSPLPQQDEVTGGYRPGAFALNYRSEPFRNRLINFPKEKSHSYSSYTFGEPATPIVRGYLADPTKIRIMHAGGEKFHVYHLHGGGDRWRANPVSDWTFNYADTGLQKDPPTTESPSQRLDSQSIGPGESFNLEIEGGAGGVQQSVGDFLFHCHIAKHYVAGMWSVWRVYNVKQPDFVPLPDRTEPPTAIDSTGLAGRSYTQTAADGSQNTVTLNTQAKLDDWIRRQLPPAGVPKGPQDPTVWNWKVVGATAPTTPVTPANAPLYLGAPADPTVFPGSPRGVEGQPNLMAIDASYALVENRPRLLFDPISGRPAYPMLRPQIGTRPPFSGGGHSGAPYLSDNANSAATGAADPTSGRTDGLCPVSPDRTLRTYNVVAIAKSYDRTGKGTIDKEGKVFVLAQDKNDVLSGRKPVTPLAIRANQGDCVAITLTNEMDDAGAFDRWSKTTMHIHHVQFDVQGSDGVSAGFAYEHSVRPYKVEDATLAKSAAANATTISLTAVDKFVNTDANGNAVKTWVMVGQGTANPEIRQIIAVNSATRTLTLNAPLKKSHASGEFAGSEFIQYRWYPDIVLDNVFWHDHVDGIHGWGHGLVGQLLVEPKGSQWLDPTSGKPVDSGTYVSIVPGANSQPLAPGVVDGPYRELVLWTIHDNDKSEFSTVNLRANPFGNRGSSADRFSSYTYGDPITPLARIYPNDPLVIRTINVSPTVDTLHFQGARFAKEFRFQQAKGVAQAGLSDTIHHGVSEKYTIILNGKPDEERLHPGDYLYFDGDQNRFAQGAWGIVRVLPGKVNDLQALPGLGTGSGTYSQPSATGKPAPATTDAGNPCSAGQPVRSWSITAASVSTSTRASKAFVPTADLAAINSGAKKVEPLVLHAVAGDCIKVRFTNALSSASGFSVAGVDRMPGSSGVTVGWGTNQSVAPGATRDYVYSVPSARLGTVTISDLVGQDATKQGLYGALIVAPKSTVSGSPTTFTDPVTGVAKDIGASVIVHAPGWRAPDYRDFTAIMSDDDATIGQDFMPYPSQVASGRVAINYGAAPAGNSFRNPGTSPWFTAYAGDPMVVHAMVAPGSEQSHVFSMGGIPWASDWRQPGSNAITADGVGPWETADAFLLGGAGGPAHMVGDLFYGDLRRPFTEAGLWGLQRVLPADGSAGCPVLKVTGVTCAGQPPVVVASTSTASTSTPSVAPTPSSSPPVAADTVTIASATFTQSTQTWNIVGTTAPASGQTVTVHLGAQVSGTPEIGRATVDGNGAWLVILPAAPATLAPTTPAQVSAESSAGGTAQGTTAATVTINP
jgi:hypothetical protein